MNTPTGTSTSTGDSQHKALAILGYIIPILFFIPLVTEAKNNTFAKFHANQQLNLLIFWVLINIVAIIPILGWLVYMVGVIAGVVFLIMGVVNAANMQQKELPLIGKYRLIK